MSPEQARGLTVDARTDILSVGVVLYEIIAGRTPFGGVNAIEVMGAILNQESAPLRFEGDQAGTRLADGMQAVIAKALRKDRAERYQSANDLLLDLKKLKEEPATHAVTDESPPAAGDKPAVKRRRLPWLNAPWTTLG
jgi:serine/threonine-protein kinase